VLVELRKLKPNPLRDFIAEDGFWGGVVCRLLDDGTIQIGAGHHRVAAAIGAGIGTVDLFVPRDMDDAAIVRVYAREKTRRSAATLATRRWEAWPARSGSSPSRS
jgi:ParB-like chromosome segregation protein Spo0J